MMGREFASAAARWLHLPEMTIRPEIVAVCNRTLDTPKIDWFRKSVPTVTQVTSDYRELLDNPKVEAVYIAVPHNLHEEFYTASLEAGKHLMGEKPFGIDLKANQAIMDAVQKTGVDFDDLAKRAGVEHPADSLNRWKEDKL